MTQEDTDSSGHQAGNMKACKDYDSFFVKNKEYKYICIHTRTYIHIYRKKSEKAHIRVLQWLSLAAEILSDLNSLSFFTYL